ncbi:hypothetical protein V0R37_16705, partial [Pollutimonas sp. H1-120]
DLVLHLHTHGDFLNYHLSRISVGHYKGALHQKITHLAPTHLAFLGKAAYAAISDQRDIAWGLQPTRFAGSVVWVLPNPSGLNRAFSLDALVREYRELRLVAFQASSDRPQLR